MKRAVPKDQPQERCHKIFVGGLPETNEADLKSFFEKHGKVTQCQFKRDQNTGRGRGFGFVSFEDSDTVDKLVILKVSLVTGFHLSPFSLKLVEKFSNLRVMLKQ